MTRRPRTILAALLLLAAPALAPGQTRTDGSTQRLGTGASGVAIPPGVDVNKLLEEFTRSRSRQQQEPLGPRPSWEAEAEPVRVLPPARETLTARGQFEEAARTLLQDGRIDEERRRFLLGLAAELGLDRREAMDLAEKIADERRKIADFFLAQVKGRDGKLTAEDQRYLEQQGRDLGLDPWETGDMIGLALERYRKREVYRSIVKEFLADGILIASEEQHLEEKRKELGLTREEHREILDAEREERLERARDVFSDIREEGRARALPERELDLYGRNLFQSPGPGAFRPVTGLAPPDHYRVGPGDTFEVFLWGRLEASYYLPVDSEGRVQFPQVGSVRVGGLTYAEAKEVLKQRAEAITGVNAAVTMAETRSVQVFVVGEVERPGAMILTPLSTVVHALMAAGGPTPIGSLRAVTLRRGGSPAASLDLYEFLREGQTRGDRPLENGDVVVVPRAQRLVHLHGQVKSPAVYELREGEGLRVLLEYAGGLAAEANAGRVQVERAVRNEQRVVLDVALGDLLGDVPLQDGDRVRVFPLAPEISNEVGLFGHVHRPGTYAHEDGMRVADLIGGTEALKPEVDLSYAAVLREDPESRERVVIPFHLGGALRNDPGQNLPLRPRDEVYVFQSSRFRPPLRAQASGEVRKPGLYRIEKGARVSDLVRLAGGLAPEAFLPRAEVLRYFPDRSRKTLYVDLGRAMEADPHHDLELADEDQLVVHPAWAQRP
ncbi:MAG: SLBB domain-containing protein, partial [Deferrisomatales bacterium]